MIRFASSSPSGLRIDVDLVIVQIGFLAAKETFRPTERPAQRRREHGRRSVLRDQPVGVFAVGDVHGDIKLIAVAWADGIQATIYAFKEITSPYWLNEKRLRDHKIALIGEKIAQAATEKPVRPGPRQRLAPSAAAASLET